MNNFHTMKIILTIWKVSFKLCKLLFLQGRYDINKEDFFIPMKDQNIQRIKCNNVLYQLMASNMRLTKLGFVFARAIRGSSGP
jgi:hypothetical protein